MAGFTRGDAGGRVVVRLASTPSTNDDVRERWRADASGRGFPHLSSVSTESQTGGRGRLGRPWVSPPGGGLAVSVLLRLDPSAVDWLGWVPLAGGLAARDALLACLGDGADARVRLKWPNDALVDGRKIAGTLGEVLGVTDREVAVVLGTGINLRLTEEQLPVPHATSLALAGVDPVDPVDGERVERRYLAALARRIDALVRERGDAVAAGLHGDYVACCTTLGRRVRVSLPGGEALVGVATGIAADGRLEVRDDAGHVHPVGAGDVERVRPDTEPGSAAHAYAGADEG